jgi:uncharacterized protein
MKTRVHSHIIDAHAHLGRWGFPTHQASAADLAMEMDAHRISATIVSHSLAISYHAPEGNRRLAEEISGFARIFGYVTVNLNYPAQMIAELDRYLDPQSPHRGKFVGVKVHQMYARHRYDSPEGMALTERLAEIGVPVLVHTFSSAIESPWNVVAAAKAYPNANIVVAHMGGDAWWEGARAARQAPNVYLELCSTYTDPEKARAAVDAVGPERVLFGTDATLFTASHMLGAMADMGLTESELEMIMGGNARRLFPSIDAALEQGEKHGAF